MTARILLTHTPAMYAGYYGPQALAGLAALGDVVRHAADTPLDAAGLIALGQGCQIIVSDRQTPGPAEAFAALPDLAAFVRCAVDIRTIDVVAASAHGVLVTQASAGFVTAVAEMGLGMMLDLARHITRSTLAYRADRPPAVLPGRELKGSTIGIMGYGAIGRELARLARALGMRVLVADPHKTVQDAGIEPVALEQLLAQSDFVVCLVVATAETENLMDAAAFARMRPDAYFINLSRGNLVDETALAEALDRRLIAGAAMDVGRAADQMPSLALARRLDVIATPHIAGLTPPAVEHQALETVAQVAAIVRGSAPVGSVNAATAYRLKRLASAAGAHGNGQRT